MSPGGERRLGTADAVVLGLAGVLGTGGYAVWGTAAAAAGRWTVLAVVLAAVVALCCAASSVDLAAAHPGRSGFGYGCARVGPRTGRLAGVASLVGRSASAAAAAGVFGGYVLPAAPLLVAVPLVVAVAVLNLVGVRWTARSAYALVGGTLAVLLVVAAVGLTVRGAPADPAAPIVSPIVGARGPVGVATAAGLVFFAFVGFARIAALGREVRDPRRLRWAVLLTLGVALLTYVLVAWALQIGLGADRLAGLPSPLAALVDTRGAPGLGVLVRVGAAVATGSALLSALAGAGRTAAAMAEAHELPAAFARVGARGTPWAADLAVAVVAAVSAVVAGPEVAIAVAACALLVHYAVVNLAALRLPAAARTWPRGLSGAGLVLCAALALLLPPAQVLITAALLAVGWTACTFLPLRR